MPSSQNQVLQADDIANVDELSVMTYVSSFRTAVRKNKDEPAKELSPDQVKETTPVVVAKEEVKKEEPKKEEPKKEEPKKEEPKKEEPKKDTNSSGLPPPWERAPDWRVYEGEDLGSRCKIKVYFSSVSRLRRVVWNRNSLFTLPLHADHLQFGYS